MDKPEPLDDKTRALLAACGIDPDTPPTEEEWSAFLADVDAQGQRLRASVERMRARLTPSELAVLEMREKLYPYPEARAILDGRRGPR